MFRMKLYLLSGLGIVFVARLVTAFTSYFGTFPVALILMFAALWAAACWNIVLGRPIAYLLGRVSPTIRDSQFPVPFAISYAMVIALGCLMISAGGGINGAERKAAEAKAKQADAVVDASASP